MNESKFNFVRKTYIKHASARLNYGPYFSDHTVTYSFTGATGSATFPQIEKKIRMTLNNSETCLDLVNYRESRVSVMVQFLKGRRVTRADGLRKEEEEETTSMGLFGKVNERVRNITSQRSP